MHSDGVAYFTTTQRRRRSYTHMWRHNSTYNLVGLWLVLHQLHHFLLRLALVAFLVLCFLVAAAAGFATARAGAVGCANIGHTVVVVRHGLIFDGNGAATAGGATNASGAGAMGACAGIANLAAARDVRSVERAAAKPLDTIFTR